MQIYIIRNSSATFSINLVDRFIFFMYLCMSYLIINTMIGSVIGDIVGSIYEFDNIKTKDFEFFQDKMDFTDDSILSFATAAWIMKGGRPDDYYLRYAMEFPNPTGAYGSGFSQWVFRAMNGDMRPYNSCGNGSAMRIGPVGWAYNNEVDILEKAKVSAECTHNHPEGIKGAQATALCIYMARNGMTKEEIRTGIENKFGYNLNFTCDEIRPDYTWGSTCQDTVPQAIICALDGIDFEDSIRNAISIGGDSDTVGCITGSIAEALYGVPDDIRTKAESYLTVELKEELHIFEDKFGTK